jgi:hypothetical protein
MKKAVLFSLINIFSICPLNLLGYPVDVGSMVTVVGSGGYQVGERHALTRTQILFKGGVVFFQEIWYTDHVFFEDIICERERL